MSAATRAPCPVACPSFARSKSAATACSTAAAPSPSHSARANKPPSSTPSPSPALVKPEQGGSGARIFRWNEPGELHTLLRNQPDLWLPDNLLLLQEYFAQPTTKPVEFHPCLEVPAAAVAAGERIVAAGGLDVAGIEYLEAPDGRLVFYDINANSNLRKPVGEAFGFEPFDRVAQYLAQQLAL